jgi:hypothetical protein
MVPHQIDISVWVAMHKYPNLVLNLTLRLLQDVNHATSLLNKLDDMKVIWVRDRTLGEGSSVHTVQYQQPSCRFSEGVAGSLLSFLLLFGIFNEKIFDVRWLSWSWSWRSGTWRCPDPKLRLLRGTSNRRNFTTLGAAAEICLTDGRKI